eukprot:4822469-Pleurochrysis_carterae.AAC.1
MRPQVHAEQRLVHSLPPGSVVEELREPKDYRERAMGDTVHAKGSLEFDRLRTEGARSRGPANAVV